MEILNENGLGKIYVCMTMVILDNQDFHVKCSHGCLSYPSLNNGQLSALSCFDLIGKKDQILGPK